MDLLLYSRQGCCLCAGLEAKLRALAPTVGLQVIDVDAEPALQARYGLEVPVIAVPQPQGPPQALPRVSPRLSGEGLARWLNQQVESLC